MAHKFVDLGKDGEKVYLYRYNSQNQEFKKIRQVLWGDWLSIDENHDYSEVGPGWLAIRWAPKSEDSQVLYIKEEHTTDERPLEVIFLDVGQGDGAILITPERDENERIMVIDAGEGDHMKRFLNHRFKAYRGFQFDSAIITHPDKDHYNGFKEIFGDHNIGFKTIYQNGLVERPFGTRFEKIGGYVEDPETGDKYMENLAASRADIEQHFSDNSTFGRREFPPLMHNALNNPRIGDFRMLSTDNGHSTHEGGRAYMPGFAPSDGRNYAIEVLGPVVEPDSNGKPRLKRISSNYGKTKNGHSVILRLHFGKYRILFGGDLNTVAEKYLLQHYTGRNRFPREGSRDSTNMVKEAQKWFGSEIMKVCHHGASDVTDEFMASVNPACFVISSGDEEGHVHPRPDLLGRLGRFGRGKSPVLLSTELQRSTREREDRELIEKVSDDISKLADRPSDNLKAEIMENIKILSKTNVSVYGSIYLKTDGKRLITAFKFEEKSDIKKWFYFEYTIDDSGKLILS